MNPIDRFKIDNLKETIAEIERLGKLEFLTDLENRVINEIARLIHDGSDEAKAELKKLEMIVGSKLNTRPRYRFLIATLQNSIRGALSAAKFSLL